MNPDISTKVIDWLRAQGLTVYEKPVDVATFLPGLAIENGALIVDHGKLKWPGDILHEAAHIATCPPSRRATLSGKLEVTPAEEMASLAWSFAAAIDTGIEPSVVFHEGGYKKGGAQLIQQYSSGLPPGGPGVPMLQWWGMTTGFPRMNLWLRESEDPA